MSSFRPSVSTRIAIKREADLDTVKPGSLLQIHRGSYTHWAVYIGDGKVCHFTVDMFKEGDSFTASLAGLSSGKGTVVVQYFEDMLAGENVSVYVNNSSDSKWKALSPEEIVLRATRQAGVERTYDLVSFNCEHFANECRYGIKASLQVDDAANGARVAAVVAAVAGVALAFGKIVFGMR